MSADKMNVIANSLSKIDQKINQGILDMARNLTDAEITNFFNQTALDFFNLAIDITRKKNMEREYGFSSYMALFETALKLNVNMPIDRFTMVILEFAPNIYNENEDFFLNMVIPDKKINTGNEFNIIQSEEFKALWKSLNATDKEMVGEKILSLTMYAHTYFCKLLLK
jgi:hypothetical protein